VLGRHEMLHKVHYFFKRPKRNSETGGSAAAAHAPRPRRQLPAFRLPASSAEMQLVSRLRTGAAIRARSARMRGRLRVLGRRPERAERHSCLSPACSFVSSAIGRPPIISCRIHHKALAASSQIRGSPGRLRADGRFTYTPARFRFAGCAEDRSLPMDHASPSDRPPAPRALPSSSSWRSALRDGAPAGAQPDVWHHVKSGWFVVRTMARHVDIFSCTAQGSRGSSTSGWRSLRSTGFTRRPAAPVWYCSSRSGGAPGAAADGGDPRPAEGGMAGGGAGDGFALCAVSPGSSRGPRCSPGYSSQAGCSRSRKSVRDGRVFCAAGDPHGSVVNMHGAWPAGLAWLGWSASAKRAALGATGGCRNRPC